jgi:hypothetical protein
LRLFAVLFAGLVASFTGAHSQAADPSLTKEYQNLDRRIQTLKASVLSLGQDLSLLDKGMLAFSGNPLIVYVSTDIDDAFELQAVELEINGNFVARQEFLPATLAAMQRGGAQRFMVKELPQGDYQLKATMVGKVGKGRDHRANIVLSFSKEKKPKTVELRISNVRERFLPEFVVKEWD